MSDGNRVITFLFEDEKNPLKWKPLSTSQYQRQAEKYKTVLFKSIAFALGGSVREEFEDKRKEQKGSVSVWASQGAVERRIPVSFDDIWDDAQSFFTADDQPGLMFGLPENRTTMHLFRTDGSEEYTWASQKKKSRGQGAPKAVKNYWLRFGPMNTTFLSLIDELLNHGDASDEDVKAITEAVKKSNLRVKEKTYTLETVAKDMKNLAEVLEKHEDCKLDVTGLHNAAGAALEFIKGIERILSDRQQSSQISKLKDYISDRNHRSIEAMDERMKEYGMDVNETGYEACSTDPHGKPISRWMIEDGKVPAPNISLNTMLDDNTSVAQDTHSMRQSVTNMSGVSNGRTAAGSSRKRKLTTSATNPALLSSPTSKPYDQLQRDVAKLMKRVYGKPSKEGKEPDADPGSTATGVTATKQHDDQDTIGNECSPGHGPRACDVDEQINTKKKDEATAADQAGVVSDRGKDEEQMAMPWPRYLHTEDMTAYHPANITQPTVAWKWPKELTEQCDSDGCWEPFFHSCVQKAETISVVLNTSPKKTQKGKQAAKHAQHFRKKIVIEQLAADYAMVMDEFLTKAHEFTSMNDEAAGDNDKRKERRDKGLALNRLWSRVVSLCQKLEVDHEMMNPLPSIKEWVDSHLPNVLPQVRDGFMEKIMELFKG